MALFIMMFMILKFEDERESSYCMCFCLSVNIRFTFDDMNIKLFLFLIQNIIVDMPKLSNTSDSAVESCVLDYFVPFFFAKQLVFCTFAVFVHNKFDICRKVRHKNVVQFIGACTRSPRLCIVTGNLDEQEVRMHCDLHIFYLSSDL